MKNLLEIHEAEDTKSSVSCYDCAPVMCVCIGYACVHVDGVVYVCERTFENATEHSLLVMAATRTLHSETVTKVSEPIRLYITCVIVK